MKKYLYSFLVMSFIASCLILPSCNLEAPAPDGPSGNPTVDKISPVAAAANGVLTLTGNGLGNITSVVFEKGNVPAGINPTLNTGGALIFRVPVDAVPGSQKIILKNGAGVEFKVDFKVLGFATITEVSNYNFSKDSEITLTGKNLDDVTKVMFAKDSLTLVSIVSKTATTLTLKFPATTLTETALYIRNAAGLATTTQSFVALDNAYKIFTDNYAPGYQDASWGDGGVVSTTEFKSGTASVYKDYAKGNWHQLGFGWTNTANDNYKYLSFWVKGASLTYDLYISTPSSPSGFASFDDFSKITVPANVWTYFKIPVSTLKLWGANGTGAAWNQIGWRIKGPDAQNERFYLDDVILIK